ncbi:MAG TPA: sugar transferase [Terracidiphilus sp.]|nr:sugar transferase [Terracidiphilus sp.]
MTVVNQDAPVVPRTRGDVLPLRRRLSPWSRSTAKRVFDCACVVAGLPFLVPVLVVSAIAVRLTSAGPVFFLQERIGRHGRPFTIFKFRTMTDAATHHSVTTAGNQQFTPVGPFLRRWKLDELPQLLNVLIGDMSLVGPRPKMREHVQVKPLCRPGITGAATFVFAREEMLLDRVPKHNLLAYYHDVVLPAKRRIDSEYMARATFASDLKLIVDSVLRRWDDEALEHAVSLHSQPVAGSVKKAPAPTTGAEGTHVVVLSHLEGAVAEQVTSVG